MHPHKPSQNGAQLKKQVYICLSKDRVQWRAYSYVLGVPYLHVSLYESYLFAYLLSYERKQAFAITRLSVCVQLLNQLISFHETWYEHYAIRGHQNVVLFNFLQSVITTWGTHEIVSYKCHQLHLSRALKLRMKQIFEKYTAVVEASFFFLSFCVCVSNTRIWLNELCIQLSVSCRYLTHHFG